MKTIQGVVAMLGYTQVRSNIVTYNVIEIGEQILTDVEVPKCLVKYLVRASRENDKESILYLSGNRLLGVRALDGKTHYSHASHIFLAGWCLLSIALVPVFGLGLYSLWRCVRHYGYAHDAATLRRSGGIRASR